MHHPTKQGYLLPLLLLALFLLCGCARGPAVSPEAPVPGVLRLHVIANSDSEHDQALKLAVRDRVLATAETLYPTQATRAESLEILSRNLPRLEEEGQIVVEEWGETDTVRAELTRCWFPTKYYDGFALPAGEYTALRVVIGEGAGQNWWCVAFPPLCLGAVSETVEDAVAAGSFTPSQGALMTGESGGYVLKFKMPITKE